MASEEDNLEWPSIDEPSGPPGKQNGGRVTPIITTYHVKHSVIS